MSRDLTAPLSQLPKYYTYRDVLTIVFADDEDAFLDAWCDGSLPLQVRDMCGSTIDPTKLTNWLLRRLIRLHLEHRG